MRFLLRAGLPQGTALLAGAEGLDREVTRPAVLRTRAPAFEALAGGELALVSLETLRLLDERLTLPLLLARLVNRHASGVAVQGDVGAESIERADQADLPLLALPSGTSLRELEQSLSALIGEARAQLYQQGAEVHRQLVELSMAGRGLPAIVERLAEITGRMAALHAGDLSVEIFACPEGVEGCRESAEELAGAAQEIDLRLRGKPMLGSNPPALRLALSGAEALVAPVIVHEAIAGFLTLLGQKDELGDSDRLVLTRASVVCALELAKQRAVVEAEQRLRGGFFEDLLTGELADEALLHRARRLGYDLSRPYAVLAVSPDGREPARSAPAAGGQDRVPANGSASSPAEGEDLPRLIERHLARRGQPAPMVTQPWGVVILYPLASPPDVGPAEIFAEDLQGYLASAARKAVSVGIGRYRPGLAGLRAAYHEAQQAMAIGRELSGPGKVTAFADLGVYRLLYVLKDNPDLEAFCRETLSSLVGYDDKNGTELVKTVETLFACRASLQATADALFLHRNSLAYRLRRIQEVSGLDLDDFEDRFRLQLALKARRLLRG